MVKLWSFGATVLMLSPATVSAPISLTEAAVLAAGSRLMLAANARSLRATRRGSVAQPGNSPRRRRS
ncbi:hypothetical protein ABIB25_004728 [Nakamurella sp. UYEF19]